MLRRKWLRRGVIVFLTVVVLWLLGSLAAAYRLTRRPRAPFAEPAPELAGASLEEQRLRTQDGEELGAWFLPGSPGKPVVLLMHGHNGSRRNCLRAATVFAKEGCTVLLVSLRAHGDSTGEFNDFGYSSRYDVVAAVDFLRQRCPNSPIIVRGHSMGAAAAVFAAALVRDQVSAWILESPYRDLRTALKHRTELAPPPFSHIAFAGLSLTGPLFLPDVDRQTPLLAIDAIPKTQPVLILAGDCDERARPEEAQALFERVADHGKLVWFPKAHHWSLAGSNPDLYRTSVLELVNRVAS